jgi:predicted SAM-dependent methyltransferase
MSETIPVVEIDEIIKKIADSNAPIKLNVGCGDNKLEGYVNIDVNPNNKPDIALDITKRLPLPDGCVDEIVMFHTIEHIEEKFHSGILSEFHRVLKPLTGVLYISYPEFSICANNYITNKSGMKDFWKHTIYGLQRAAGDYHVALMDTIIFVDLLQECGFQNIQYQEECGEHYNTIVRAMPGAIPQTYEDNLSEYVFAR